MSWFDQPKKWWVYRWTHHFWVLSFNRNPDLYRVVWWSRYTRPMFYNTRGRLRSSGMLWMLFFFVGGMFLVSRTLLLFNYLLGAL